MFLPWQGVVQVASLCTAGGLLGKVAKLGDSNLGLEIANGVEVQIQRSAVVQVLPKGSIK